MGTAPLGVFNVRYLSLVCILIVLSLFALHVFHSSNIISRSKQTQQVRMYNFILFRWARMQDPKCRHVSVSKKRLSALLLTVINSNYLHCLHC